MEVKISRGIQQLDVWDAADALIAEGQRPTIERVRLKIGRGSPNTVSPMLDAWFATLGQRLGVTEIQNRAGTLPDLVLKAATELWSTAQQSAQENALEVFTAARNALDAEQLFLQTQQHELKLQEQVLNERQMALEDSLNTARIQIADLSERLNSSKASLAQKDRRIDDLLLQMIEVEKLRDAERRQRDEEGKNHVEERRRLEERAAMSERRLLVEVDRERQKIKLSKVAFSEAEKNADQLKNALEVANKSLEDRLQKAQAELQIAQQALVSATSHGIELRRLFDMQSTAQQVVQKRMNLRTTTPERKKAAMALTKRRKI